MSNSRDDHAADAQAGEADEDGANAPPTANDLVDDNLRLLAGQLPDSLMLLDRDEKIRFINRTVPDLTVDAVIGRAPYEFIPPTEADKARRAYRAVLSEGSPQRFETDYIAEDGTKWRYEVRATPFVKNGQVEGIIVVSTNVTERDEAASELARFFEVSADLICVIDRDGTLRRVNAAATQLLGDGVELPGRALIDFVHPDDRPATSQQLAHLAAAPQTVTFECRCASRDDGYRTLEWRATSTESPGRIYAAARDVTEQQALEHQLRQSQKMEAIGQLAGGIAHDFNNLLLATTLNTQFALKHVADATAKQHLEEVLDNTQRASHLTRRLLAFSREKPLAVTELDINDLIADMLHVLRRTIPASIEIDVIPGHHLPTVSGDAAQLEQILLNLCLNARDALPDGGRIVIETETVIVNGRYRETHPWARAGRYVLLTVTDNGRGMTDDVRERIFEPFFTTKGPGEGTGLGLATAYAIVQQHDGMIHVYSEPGTGTTFKIYLPVGERLASRVGDKLEEVATPTGSETILVAEDAPTVRPAVVKALESAGYRVVVARDGDEAVDLARKHGDHIALALLDLVMPKRNGPATAAAITADHPHIRVLYTSGYSDPRMVGSEDEAKVLKKPYEMDELLRRVRATLDEPHLDQRDDDPGPE